MLGHHHHHLYVPLRTRVNSISSLTCPMAMGFKARRRWVTVFASPSHCGLRRPHMIGCGQGCALCTQQA